MYKQIVMIGMILIWINPGYSQQKTLPEFIDSLSAILMRDNDVPGGIITVVENGQPVYCKGFGVSNISNGNRIDTARSSFRIASVTKIFTTITILKLAAEGKLSLDKDIRSELEELGVRLRFGDPVSMRQLLSHTSGIENSDINDASRDSGKVIPLLQFCKRNRVVQIHKPGTTWHYSNAGMTIAGAIAEQTTGISFSALVKQYVLDPLGMKQTHFGYFDKNWPTGYEEDDSKFYEVHYEYPNTYPGGGLSSTAVDMSKFLSALTSETVSIPENLKEELFRRQFSYGEQAGQALGFDEELYGISRNAIGSTKLYTHSGSRPGFASLLMVVPERSVAIFISLNARENSVCSFIGNRIINRFYPGDKMDSSLASPTIQLDLKEYTGEYVLVNAPSGTLEKLGFFLKGSRYKKITAVGDDSLSLAGQYMAYPISKDNFRLRNSNRIISFIRNEKGQVEYTALDLNKFRKISWYQSQAFYRRTFLSFNIIFLVWSIYGIVQLIRKKKKDRTHIMSVVTSVIGFLIPIYLIIEVSNAPEQLFDYGVPFYITVIPILILMVAIGFLLTLVFFIRDYNKIKTGRLYKILFSMLCLAALGSLFWYDHFNLLGFKY